MLPMYNQSRSNYPVPAIFIWAFVFVTAAAAEDGFVSNLIGPSEGLRVTTAVSEGERDFYSFKTLTDVTASSYTVAYDNSERKASGDGPFPGALVYRTNLDQGFSFFPGFARNLPKERKNSTALALPKNLLLALKNGDALEIDQGLGSYYSTGKISFTKFGETEVIWDDRSVIVPTVHAEYKGNAKNWNGQPLGTVTVKMEILDDQNYPIRLHSTATMSGESGTHYTVQTISIETGQNLEERFGAAFQKGESYTSYDLRFDYNSAEVLPRMYRALNAIANYLEANREYKTIIVGHTDSRGSDDYNSKLSARRAEAIADTLTNRFGLDQTRFTTRGLGETMPIATNETLLGRSYNRRVEFRPFN